MPEQATNKIEEAPICGICGDLMVWKRGKYKCEICEYFFGTSSRINRCSKCGNKFGRYKVVEERFLSIFHLTEEGKKELDRRLCPKCRGQSPYFNEIRETLVEKIKYELEQGNFTGYKLASQIADSTPKNVEFIRYCSGDVEGRLSVVLERIEKDRLESPGICQKCGKQITDVLYYWEPATGVLYHTECHRKLLKEREEERKEVEKRR